jgi:hypothetical protein
VIQFPDIEAALVRFLKAEGVTASTNYPKVESAEFATLFRSGGARSNPVTENALVVFEAWGSDKGKARALGERLRGLVGERVGIEANVKRVGEVGGLAWLPDPDNSKPRYTFTAEFRVKGITV